MAFSKEQLRFAAQYLAERIAACQVSCTEMQQAWLEDQLFNILENTRKQNTKHSQGSNILSIIVDASYLEKFHEMLSNKGLTIPQELKVGVYANGKVFDFKFNPPGQMFPQTKQSRRLQSTQASIRSMDVDMHTDLSLVDTLQSLDPLSLFASDSDSDQNLQSLFENSDVDSQSDLESEDCSFCDDSEAEELPSAEQRGSSVDMQVAFEHERAPALTFAYEQAKRQGQEHYERKKTYKNPKYNTSGKVGFR